MDPLKIFPPEIVHQVWSYLEPRDLLAARAVARHWLASVTDCPGAWVTDFSHDWIEFLSVKKTIRSWSSKNVKRQTIRNVKGYVFQESTFYLLFDDGSLIMFDDSGRAIRKFTGRVSSIHSSQNGLLISLLKKGKNLVNLSVASDHVHEGDYNPNILDSVDECVDENYKNLSIPKCRQYEIEQSCKRSDGSLTEIKQTNVQHETQLTVTLLTDSLMNVIDEFPNVAILRAFQNGFLCSQGGHLFVDINQTKLCCSPGDVDLPPNRIALCSKSIFTVNGLIDKVVSHYDLPTNNLSTLSDIKPRILHSFKSSPMAIPHVVIAGQKDPYICITAEIGHFTKVFVYLNEKLIIENTVETCKSTNFFFTDDFFVVSSAEMLVYPLQNVHQCWTCELNWSSSLVTGTHLLSPLVPNCFAVFDLRTNTLKFFCIHGELQSVSKMGTLESISHMERCFPSYGYSVYSGREVDLYYFSPD